MIFVQAVLFISVATAVFVRLEARAVNISNTWVLPEERFPVFYRYFRDRISWYEADAVCQFHHGNLVTVDTASQFDAVRAYLKELDIVSNVWIGLQRPSDKKTFSWSSGSTLSGEGYWGESAPTEGAVCAATDSAKDFRWHALTCGGPEIASFICELPVPPWANGADGCMLTSLPSLTVIYLPEQTAVELTSDCGLDGTKRIACKGKADHEEMMRQLSCGITREDFDEKSVSKAPFSTTTRDSKTAATKPWIWTSNTIDTGDYGSPTRHRRETEDTFSTADITLGLSTTDITSHKHMDTTETISVRPFTQPTLKSTFAEFTRQNDVSGSSSKPETTNQRPGDKAFEPLTTLKPSSQTPKQEVTTFATDGPTEDIPSAAEYPSINQGQLFSIIENGTIFDIIEVNNTSMDVDNGKEAKTTMKTHLSTAKTEAKTVEEPTKTNQNKQKARETNQQTTETTKLSETTTDTYVTTKVSTEKSTVYYPKLIKNLNEPSLPNGNNLNESSSLPNGNNPNVPSLPNDKNPNEPSSPNGKNPNEHFKSPNSNEKNLNEPALPNGKNPNEHFKSPNPNEKNLNEPTLLNGKNLNERFILPNSNEKNLNEPSLAKLPSKIETSKDNLIRNSKTVNDLSNDDKTFMKTIEAISSDTSLVKLNRTNRKELPLVEFNSTDEIKSDEITAQKNTNATDFKDFKGFKDIDKDYTIPQKLDTNKNNFDEREHKEKDFSHHEHKIVEITITDVERKSEATKFYVTTKKNDKTKGTKAVKAVNLDNVLNLNNITHDIPKNLTTESGDLNINIEISEMTDNATEVNDTFDESVQITIDSKLENFSVNAKTGSEVKIDEIEPTIYSVKQTGMDNEFFDEKDIETDRTTQEPIEPIPEAQPRPNRNRVLTRPQRRSFYPYFFSRVLG